MVIFVLLYTFMPLPSTPLFTASGIAGIKTLNIIPAFLQENLPKYGYEFFLSTHYWSGKGIHLLRSLERAGQENKNSTNFAVQMIKIWEIKMTNRLIY